jgi:hypothetical protein
MKRSGDIASLF